MANDPSSDLIEAALNEALKLKFDEHEEGDLVHEWVIIAHVSNAIEDKGDAYPMMFSNGRMPTHSARGLLHTGLRMLDDDGKDED